MFVSELPSAILLPKPLLRMLFASSVTRALEVLSAEKLRAWAFKYVRKLFADHQLSAIVTPTIGKLPPKLSKEAKVSDCVFSFSLADL